MSAKSIYRRFFPKKVKHWTERFEVGRRTYCSYGEPNILHWGEPAKLKVGAFCSLAGGINIFLGGNHRTDWITTFPFPAFLESGNAITDFTTTKGDVVIGNDVWIGEGVTILSGVRIGNGSVVGTRSVVTKDVPPYGIVAGNPAKLIRLRFTDSEIAHLQQLAWWDWPDSAIEKALPYLLSNNIPELLKFSKNKHNFI